MTTYNLHKYLRLTAIILTVMMASAMWGQENKVPLTVTSAWPAEPEWGTRLENMTDGDHKESQWVAKGPLVLDYLQIKNPDNTDDGRRSWIELPYVPNENTEIEIVFAADKLDHIRDWRTQYIFGCGTPDFGAGMALGMYNDGAQKFSYKVSKQNGAYATTFDTEKHTVIFNAHSIKFDSNAPIDLPSYSYINGTRNLCFFGSPDESQDWGGCFEGKIYSVKIRENGNLIYDLVPYKSGTDEYDDYARCGFYDLLTKQPVAYFFEMLDFVENSTAAEENANKNNLHFNIPYTNHATNSYTSPWSASLVSPLTAESTDLSATSFHVNGEGITGSVITEDGAKVLNVVCDGSKNGDSYDATAQQLFVNLSEALLPGDEYYISFTYRSSYTMNDVSTQAHNQTYGYNHWQLLDPLPDMNNNWQHGVWTGVVSSAQGRKGGMNRIVFNLNRPDRNYAYNYQFKDFIVMKKSAATDNLIQNGDFTVADNLTSFPTQGSDVTASIEDDDTYGKALHVTCPERNVDADYPYYDYASQLAIKLNDGEALLPGDKYIISFSYKAGGSFNANVQVWGATSGSFNAMAGFNVPFTDSWQTGTWTGTVTEDQGQNGGLGYIALNLNVEGHATEYWFANVVVKKLPADVMPDTELEIDFQNTYTGTDYSTIRHLFSLGTKESEAISMSVKGNGFGTYQYTNGGVTEETTIKALEHTGRMTATFRPGECTIDGKTFLVGGQPDWTNVQSLYLMGTHSTSDGNAKSLRGRLYGAKIRERQGDGTMKVVLNLQPARDGNGQWGLWDKVSKKFYTKCNDTGFNSAAGVDFGGAVTNNSVGIPQGNVPFTFTMETITPVKPKRFMYTTGEDIKTCAKDLKLYGSNDDGATWTEIRIGRIMPAFSAPATDGNTVQYLYNVEAGKFLSRGNEWGTRASIKYGTFNDSQFKPSTTDDTNYDLLNFVDNWRNDWMHMTASDDGTVWTDGGSAEYWTFTACDNGMYQISSTKSGLAGKQLGTKADVLNEVTNTRLYLSGDALNTHWAFVNAADYATYQTAKTNKTYSYLDGTTVLPQNNDNWFDIVDNTTAYKKYRLDVTINSSYLIKVKEMALTADYTFEHYEGRVYDGSTANDERIPENLRWGSNSTYPDKWKTSKDDPRLGNSVTIQRTHEFVHELYVEAGNTIDLTPFKDFATTGNYREKYVRWYDYRTDRITDRLTFDPQKGSNVLATDYGFISGETLASLNRRTGTVAQYTAKAQNYTYDAETGVVDIIAIEAAMDFTGTNELSVNGDNYNLKEPTITWRHIFIIKDTHQLADRMADNNAEYIAEKKIKLMCPKNVPFQYPLPYVEYNQDNQDLPHPMDFYYRSGSNYYYIYHYLIETYRKNNDNSLTLIGKSKLNHASGTPDNTFGTINYNDTPEADKEHVAISYKAIDNYNRVFYIKNPEEGNYVIKFYGLDRWGGVIKLPDGNTPMQIMEYDLEVLPTKDGAMVNETTLATGAYEHQRPENLVQAYGKATTTVDFDEVDLNETYTNGDNHYFKWPWKWEDSSYGYVYDDTDHGDYNMYMVIDNSNMAKYQSFADVKDRRFADTGKKGFFFYANAASDPGRMALLNIGRNFCPNTTIYVSAWICELQGNNTFAETANVVFSFRGVKADGTETLLNSFVTGYVSGGWNTPTGYFPKTKAQDPNDNTKEIDVINHVDPETNPDNRGKWMHVYYTFVPPVTGINEFDHYIITLENNCTSSEGADYAIDDIRAYVCKPDMKARQTQPLCNGEKNTKLEMFADFDRLKKAYAFTEGTGSDLSFNYCFLDYDKYEKSLKDSYDELSDELKLTYPTLQDWRDKKTDGFPTAYQNAFNAALLKGTYGVTDPSAERYNYGVITLKTTYTANDTLTVGTGANIVRNVLFDCNATDANMKIGKRYIVAMIPSSEGHDANAFNLEESCKSVNVFEVSTPFGEVKIDGMLSSDLQDLNFCANEKPMVTINLNGISQGGEPVEYSSAYFDWYLGPLSHQDGYTAYREVNDGNGQDLDDAMEMLRLKYRTATQADIMGTSDSPVTATGTDPSTDFTQAMLDLIQKTVNDGKLILHELKEPLSTADQYNENRKSKFYITAIPINPADPSENVKFCLTPLQISVNLNPRAPSLQDGHHAISYPAEMKDVPLRIGLKQLQRTTISSLNHAWDANDKLLRIPLRNVQPSQDEHGTPLSEELKKLEVTNTSGLRRADDDLVYLISSTDPNVIGGIDIYEYKQTNAMYDEFVSDLKVIGRLKTIVATPSNASDNICYIAFLDNFRFKEGYEYTIKFHFEDYVGHKPINACPGDAVFTIKVVPEYQMWTGAVSRNWNDDRNWKRVTRAELLNPTEGNVPDEFVVGTSNGNTASFSPADFTKVIIPANCERVPYMYDAHTGNLTSMKFVGAELENSSQRTESNPTGSIATVIGEASATDATHFAIQFDMASEDIMVGGVAKDVACRPWYDHTCDQIHFNAGAELMDQRYLYYNKAWCDIDVPVGTWQTVASPLMNIVAGDLYLPTATARQETPLFENITYQTSLNDRFKPAVFQKSWNKGGKATVYKIDGNSTNVGINLDWSHVYNDVNVKYGAGQGFAIKVDVSAMDGGGSEPKASPAVATTVNLDYACTNGSIINLCVNGQYLYGKDAQNCAMGTADEACSDKNAVIGYKVEKYGEEQYLFRCVTPQGEDYGLWGDNPCYLNSQPSATGVTFNLGKDKDVTNGSSWTLEADGSLKCVANNGYFNGTSMSTKPVTVSFATIKTSIPAKFRFPKADKQYTYYNPNNTDGDKKTEDVNNTDIVNGVRPGRLGDLSGTFQQQVGGDTQTSTSYFLVGNPLMCWLDMEKFFNKNTQFEKKYWIVTAQGQNTALFSEENGWVTTLMGDARYIAPGKSFFLKANTAATTQSPQFTSEMMSYTQGEQRNEKNDNNARLRTRGIDGTVPQLGLTVLSANGRQSRAVIYGNRNASAENTAQTADCVPALFDSNLSSDAMIYTSRHGEALSIASIALGDTLPIGIAQGNTGERLSLHIDGADRFDMPLYLIDSELGTVTPLNELADTQTADNRNGETHPAISINDNCPSGIRYYITTSPASSSQMQMEVSMPRITVHTGGFTIHAPANADITASDTYTASGIHIHHSGSISNSLTIPAPSGIYVVKLQMNGTDYEYKVRVR